MKFLKRLPFFALIVFLMANGCSTSVPYNKLIFTTEHESYSIHTEMIIAVLENPIDSLYAVSHSIFPHLETQIDNEWHPVPFAGDFPAYIPPTEPGQEREFTIVIGTEFDVSTAQSEVLFVDALVPGMYRIGAKVELVRFAQDGDIARIAWGGTVWAEFEIAE